MPAAYQPVDTGLLVGYAPAPATSGFVVPVSSRPKLLERRLLLFTGKGGVGKTTCVAGLALEAARRGRRPLIVELGHRASMEGVFGTADIGYLPREVGHGVSAMNLDFESALEEYFVEHVPVKRIARSISRNKTLEKFFHAAPSVSEVAILNKLSGLEGERLGTRMRWDPIFVDLDATGHAMMLLNLPSVMSGLIGDGPMRRLIDGFSSLLKDPRRTVLSLVTLPRELPAQETIELWQRLHRQRDVELGVLFVNQVPAVGLTQAQTGWLDRIGSRAAALGITTVVDDVAIAHLALRRHANARAQIERMRVEVGMPLVELPVLADTAPSIDTLAELGRATSATLDAMEVR